MVSLSPAPPKSSFLAQTNICITPSLTQTAKVKDKDCYSVLMQGLLYVEMFGVSCIFNISLMQKPGLSNCGVWLMLCFSPFG